MSIDDRDQAKRLARLWDAIISGTDQSNAAPDLLAEISFVDAALSVPPPSAATRDRMWQAVIASSHQVAAAHPLVTSPNGVSHEPIPATASVTPERWASFWRSIAIATIGGFSAGFLAGVWARLAMRASGFLTIDRNRGLITEAEARVGEITFGGTLFLALMGAALGILGGLLYVAVRRWLPANPVSRATSFGLLLLGVFGFIVMDEHNADYHLFGPPWLNVLTFSLTYLVYGVLVSVFVERMHARLPQLAIRHATSLRQKTLSLLLVPFAVIGAIGIVFAMIASFGDLGAAIMGSVLLVSGIAYLTGLSRWRLPMSATVVRWAGTAALVVPGLLGVFLTTQGIVGILTG